MTNFSCENHTMFIMRKKKEMHSKENMTGPNTNVQSSTDPGEFKMKKTKEIHFKAKYDIACQKTAIFHWFLCMIDFENHVIRKDKIWNFKAKYDGRTQQNTNFQWFIQIIADKVHPAFSVHQEWKKKYISSLNKTRWLSIKTQSLTGSYK